MVGTGTLNGRTIHTNIKVDHFSPEVTQSRDGSRATLADSLGPYQTLSISFSQTRDPDN